MEKVFTDFLLHSFFHHHLLWHSSIKPRTTYKCQEVGIEWQESKSSNESKNLNHIPWLHRSRN